VWKLEYINGVVGSGFVEEIGSAVGNVKLNDPVIMSFASCGKCYNCDDDHPAYCVKGFEHNFVGEKGMYSAAGNGNFDIAASFFGQSSFACMAIVKARSLINVSGLGVTTEELKMLAPLGCGIQTGAGAMTTIADVKPDQDVAILGTGGVGQSAIMVRSLPFLVLSIGPKLTPSMMKRNSACEVHLFAEHLTA
jgi:Zn-dependent alcohol dehydrogenase